MLKCEEVSVILTGRWAAGQNWKGESQFDQQENDRLLCCPAGTSQDVYELRLSAVNQVIANGEALMNLALIRKGQSFYNTIICQLE